MYKMKCLLLFISLATLLDVIAGESCKLEPRHVGKKWKNMMSTECINAVKNHTQEEIKASMTYLSMAIHFAQADVNLPGFSELFFKAAKEEREHAIKLMEYLLMRGQDLSHANDNFPTLIRITDAAPTAVEWNGLDALDEALALENIVTEKIRNVISVCEGTNPNKNDYHLVDYLTTEFLDEQHKGERDLAGKLSILYSLIKKNGDSLALFLFDKKLLRGEI